MSFLTQDEVVELMKGSKTEAEWDANADAAKKAYGGWPHFWYTEIIDSMLFAKKLAEFQKNAGK